MLSLLLLLIWLALTIDSVVTIVSIWEILIVGATTTLTIFQPNLVKGSQTHILIKVIFSDINSERMTNWYVSLYNSFNSGFKLSILNNFHNRLYDFFIACKSILYKWNCISQHNQIIFIFIIVSAVMHSKFGKGNMFSNLKWYVYHKLKTEIL